MTQSSIRIGQLLQVSLTNLLKMSGPHEYEISQLPGKTLVRDSEGLKHENATVLLRSDPQAFKRSRLSDYGISFKMTQSLKLNAE